MSERHRKETEMATRFARGIVEYPCFDEDLEGPDVLCRWCVQLPSREGHTPDCLYVAAVAFLAAVDA